MTDQETSSKKKNTSANAAEQKKPAIRRRPRSSYQKAMSERKFSEPTEMEQGDIEKKEPPKKETKKTEVKKPELKKTESIKTETIKTEVIKREGNKAEGNKPEVIKTEGIKVEGNKPEAIKTEGIKVEGNEPEPQKKETKKYSRNSKPRRPRKPARENATGEAAKTEPKPEKSPSTRSPRPSPSPRPPRSSTAKNSESSKTSKPPRPPKTGKPKPEVKASRPESSTPSGKRMVRISRSADSESSTVSDETPANPSKSKSDSRRRASEGSSKRSTRPRDSHKSSRHKPSVKIQGYRHNYGLLLLNMGGPTSKKMIGDYLYRLFSDPHILSIPGPFRKMLARFLSVTRRNKSAARYQLIGGKSPLKEETEAQVYKLEKLLGIPVTYAMRYTEPFVEAGQNLLAERGVNRLIVLPLYPQYCHATTLSALKDFQEHRSGDQPYRFIEHHYDFPLYIRSMAGLLRKSLQRLDPELKTAIVFAAHSIPQKQVAQGDPYVDQIRSTVEMIASKNPLPFEHVLAFQSKIGPVKWQGPTLEEALQELRSQEIEQIVVQPVSFVSENLETLYDLDIDFKEKSLKAGIKNYIRVPTPGTRPSFMEAMALLVKKEIETWEVPNAPRL